jgi:phage-related protein
VSGVVQNVFRAMGAAVDQQGTGRFEYFKTWIDQNLPRIQQIVQSILGAIMGFWENHGETIMRVVNNFMENVRIVIDTVLKTIMDIVQFFLQVFTGDFEGAGETLKGIVERIWEAVKQIFWNSLDSIRAIFQNFDWGQIGRNILDGIRQGVINATSALLDTLRGVGERIVGLFRGVFDMHSPSRVMANEVGVPLAQGIGVGLQKGLASVGGQLQGAIDSLMGDVNLAPSLQVAGAGAQGGGSTNYVTIHIQGGDRETSRLGVLDGLRQAGMVA